VQEGIKEDGFVLGKKDHNASTIVWRGPDLRLEKPRLFQRRPDQLGDVFGLPAPPVPVLLKRNLDPYTDVFRRDVLLQGTERLEVMRSTSQQEWLLTEEIPKVGPYNLESA
jgi:hypothetical protein